MLHFCHFFHFWKNLFHRFFTFGKTCFTGFSPGFSPLQNVFSPRFSPGFSPGCPPGPQGFGYSWGPQLHGAPTREPWAHPPAGGPARGPRASGLTSPRAPGPKGSRAQGPKGPKDPRAPSAQEFKGPKTAMARIPNTIPPYMGDVVIMISYSPTMSSDVRKSVSAKFRNSFFMCFSHGFHSGLAPC